MISLFRIYKSNIATNFFFHLLVTQTQNVFNQSVCIFSSFSQYYNAYFIYAIRQLVYTCIVIILLKIFFFSYHYYLFFFFFTFQRYLYRTWKGHLRPRQSRAAQIRCDDDFQYTETRWWLWWFRACEASERWTQRQRRIFSDRSDTAFDVLWISWKRISWIAHVNN